MAVIDFALPHLSPLDMVDTAQVQQGLGRRMLWDTALLFLLCSVQIRCRLVLAWCHFLVVPRVVGSLRVSLASSVL